MDSHNRRHPCMPGIGRALLGILLLLSASSAGLAQSPPPKGKPPATRRISFAEGKKLLSGQTEGNETNQPGRFTRSVLGDGRVLELFYPISVPASARRSGRAAAPGYGILYESEAAFHELTRPHHMLEELIPDGRSFVASIPQLVARLEKRLGRLDYSRESLRRLDGLVAGFHSTHTTAQTDPRLFQELTAYYGETLRRALQAEWKIREEKVGKTHVQTEPNLAVLNGGKNRELKPWSSVITALFDEDKRGIRLTKVFDADLSALK
ncbi:MAG: hypothetical protein SF339_03570 [Blastocatellia bacterium]|nr:hypothetical protein [Blastocatellia bacterium]